jgi:predicted adenylyl cyclase CyaB
MRTQMENYDINIKAKIEDYETYIQKIEKIADFFREDEKEVYHLSSKNIGINNIRSPDKFRVIRRNNEYIVKFRKLINEEKSGIDIVEEKEFETQDFDNLIELFKALGFVIFMKEVEKTKKYKYKQNKNVIIKLTQLEGLGNFVEIVFPCSTENDKEFAKMKVNKICEELEIGKDKIENKFYLQLLLDKKKNEG